MFLTHFVRIFVVLLLTAPLARASEYGVGSSVEGLNRVRLPELGSGLRWQFHSVVGEGFPPIQKFVVVESHVQDLRDRYWSQTSDLDVIELRQRAELEERVHQLRYTTLGRAEVEVELRDILRNDLGYSRREALTLTEILISNPSKDLGKVAYDFDAHAREESRLRSAAQEGTMTERLVSAGEKGSYVLVEIDRALYAEAEVASEIQSLLDGELLHEEKRSKIEELLRKPMYYQPRQAHVLAKKLLNGEMGRGGVAQAFVEFDGYIRVAQELGADTQSRQAFRRDSFRRKVSAEVSVPNAVRRAGKK